MLSAGEQKEEQEQPRRVLFLYEHYADDVKCIQPDYFTSLEEAQSFYQHYTGSHIKPIRLYEADRSGYTNAGQHWPYEQPKKS